jgi:hypothetical protein
MKVFLTSAYQHDFAANWLRSHSPVASSICTDSPEKADAIIFVEAHPGHDPYFRDVLKTKIYKQYRSKCVLYHDADRSITTMPTLSPSIEAWQFNSRHKRIAHYIARQCDNDAVNNAVLDFSPDRPYLYCFYGNKSHKVRDEIFEMLHPDDAFVKDMAGAHWWRVSDQERLAYGLEFVRVMQDSYFSLTPRGIGPASYRLFETMQLGRVPVIISDAWLKVPGIDWDTFSITVPENSIPHIPAILRERKEDAVEMGKLAKKCWDEYFSPEVSLMQLAVSACALVQNQYTILDEVKDYAQFLEKPWHLKNYLRARIKRKLNVESIFPKRVKSAASW